jgi:hypothetical protein
MAMKKERSVRLACRCLMLAALFLQTCHATSIVWVVSDTGDYVVFAADSRQFDVRRQKAIDKVCKVVALDDSVFFTSGDARIEVDRGASWDSIQTALEIYKASTDHNAQSLSIAWGNRATAWFGGKSSSFVESVMGDEGTLVHGGFISFPLNRGSPEVFSQTTLQAALGINQKVPRGHDGFS